jgi:hypothetical protein
VCELGQERLPLLRGPQAQMHFTLTLRYIVQLEFAFQNPVWYGRLKGPSNLTFSFSKAYLATSLINILQSDVISRTTVFNRFEYEHFGKWQYYASGYSISFLIRSLIQPHEALDVSSVQHGSVKSSGVETMGTFAPGSSVPGHQQPQQ